MTYIKSTSGINAVLEGETEVLIKDTIQDVWPAGGPSRV